MTLLPEQLRQEPTGLANLMIATPLGPVPLSKVARITSHGRPLQHRA